MTRLGIFGVIVGASATVAGIVGAQERPQLAQNREAGKTPAQLFASDCAICHKSPQGLGKAGGLFGLSNFLRQHYTASKENAAALTDYLASVGGVRPGQGPRAGKPRAPKREERAKASDGKPGEAKPAVAQPGQDKKPDPEAPGQPAKPVDDNAAASSAGSGPGADSEPAAKPSESKPEDTGKSEKTE